MTNPEIQIPSSNFQQLLADNHGLKKAVEYLQETIDRQVLELMAFAERELKHEALIKAIEETK